METPTPDESVQISPIAQYYSIRKERLELNKQAAMLEVEEAKLKRDIIRGWDTLSKPEGFVVDLTTINVPFVEDWPAFIQWVRETNSVDCFQKRITESAVKARLDDGKAVPGVIIVPKQTLTVEINGQI
jgi:hypothetical protein